MLSKTYSNKKNTCEVTFTLPVEATAAKAVVRVLGEFNNWNAEKAPVMKAKADQYQATIELECGRSYEFRYLINEVIWENDWAADAYATTPYAGVFNSVVIVDGAVAPKKVTAAKKPATKVAKEPVATAPKAEKAPSAKVAAPKASAPKATAPKAEKAVAAPKAAKAPKTAKK